MADPAVEAARRAWRVQYGMEPLDDASYTIRSRTLAAREALKPIRERVEHLRNPNLARMSPLWWEGVEYVLDELAPLIYITEELAQ
ncbi:hypothetical protein [Mycolicibacterium peregrinum]|uniref:hypothetical protein n=1 Tax=Mycolicibacterium peregrinum TaxID=43304 RepID=UPI003AAEC432